MADTCKHEIGDSFNGNWICAHCFRPLEQRPVRYAMVGTGEGKHQDVVWKADIAKDSAGTQFSTFLAWMVSALRRRSLWTISKHEALRQCLEVLRDQGEPFGSSEACWGKDDAKELVVEGICSYWDEASSGANA